MQNTNHDKSRQSCWKKTIGLIFIVFFAAPLNAKNLHKEKYYQAIWCAKNNGQIEYTLPDRTRCDCLTSTHAIEFDFGKGWTEAVGQSLYYAMQTGKRPGIVLIIETEKDFKYWLRLNSTIERFGLPIDTWLINEHLSSK